MLVPSSAAPLNDSLDLADRVALVTRANQGIGRKIAMTLAMCGGRIATSADVACAVPYLVSPVGDYVAAQTLFVTGGEAMVP
jgi:NAD(P)-dependent dehydrogenase (short-subunit alcohol dehydrogenase family)